MKKLGKSSKKGFTLVELIVVLVILAVLAAMLVPALIGYIDRARQEKEFQAASTIYAAAQALATEAYGKASDDEDIEDYVTVAKIKDLTGVEVSSIAYDVEDQTAEDGAAYAITAFSVTFDGTNWYNYTVGANAWDTGLAATASQYTADAVEAEEENNGEG
jgi:prepilin-type N-terminal cleavage/methylation domain-containing protein